MRIGPQVDVLVELAADGDEQAPQGHVVGDVRCADGAEKGGVAGGELVDAVDRHHAAVAAVVVRTPISVAPRDAEAEGGAEGVYAGHGCGHDLEPDAVAGDDVNGVGVLAHGVAPVWGGS